MSPKKVGKRGLVIHSQGREIIHNVSQFMKKEAEEGITIPLKSHKQRTFAATKILRTTYDKIEKESLSADTDNNPSTSFSTPRKKRPRISQKFDLINPEQLQSIRELIYDFYVLEKRRPTLKLLKQKILDKQILSEYIGITSLRHLLHNMGFRWQKTEEKRKLLVESHDIRIKRIEYLKTLTQYRNEGRNIIYTDETYIHSNHTQDKGWFDDSCKGIREPISKGERLIIVHAGGESGFILDGLLIFRSGSKTDDEMNSNNFMTWVEKQLLPNMPVNSVLVVDNAPYRNIPIKKNITSTSRKCEMIEWLKEKNISFDQNLTKPEIYEIILQNKDSFPTRYKLDDLLERHGHKVLRLPPYHPELNPMEKIWTTVKNWVASRNVTFKLADVEMLTRQKFSEITVEDWVHICQHVKKHEQILGEREHLYDEAIELLGFTINTGSSDESFDSDTESSNDSESSLECLPLSMG